MNLSLKHKLMLQSLSPLAFLTIVRNFKFTPVSELAENQSYWGEFVRLNNVLIVVFLLCATWILAAIISFISFTAFRWTDKKQGYQLSSFVEKEDASLNFFMTMIIPLLIDDVGTIQGAVTFLIIVVMMCALLSKTHLYYANPVLAILGYRVYEITFKSNGLSSVHSMGFRQFIFYLAHKVDFIAEIFLCTMILFGNVGAQPAASFLLKFASFAKFLKQPESLCCFCTNQIFNFFSCNTAVFQCILKNE